MNDYRVLTAENWPRWKQYEFYQSFDCPMYDMTVALAAGPLAERAAKAGDSFFLLSLYAILRAANDVPQLRQRTVDGEVREFEHIAVVTPILNEEELCNEVWLEYEPNFQSFCRRAIPLVEQARQATQDPIMEDRQDFFCASCIPWIHFQAGTIANCQFHQTVPVIGWGKLENNRVPVMAKFNHAFVDGLHLSRFFNAMGLYFSEPNRLE